MATPILQVPFQGGTMSRVMIWGGTRGLGRELARASLTRGHPTIVTGRGRTRPDDLEREIGFIRADFTTIDGPDNDTRDMVGSGFYTASLNTDILFWCAGTWLRRPLHLCTFDEVQDLFNVHLVVPALHLRHLFELRAQSDIHGWPFHLVTIASSSARKVRDDGQAAYGAVQAGKVQFARNLCAESPGLISRSTIVRPGGMKTEFFRGSDVDTSAFADPVKVAEAIWHEVENPNPIGHIELDIAQVDGQLIVRHTDNTGTPWSL